MGLEQTAITVGGFGIALAAILILSRVAVRLGLIDHPVGRKAHQRPTPLVGGVGIAIGAVTALVLSTVIWPETIGTLEGDGRYLGLLVGASGLLVLGAWDDRSEIPARYKLVIQALLCSVAVLVDGNLIGNLGVTVGPWELSLGPLVAPVSLLVMLTIINALNMIDGVDGLAGGIAFCALSIMAKAAIAGGFSGESLILCAVLGGLAGFLLLNFPIWPNRKAHVFLGDGGTLMLGFLVAYFALDLSALPERVFRPSTAIWFFFIPVTDTILLYLRRTLRDRAPARAGRDHIHHILLACMPPWAASWTLVGASACLAGGAYLAERLGARPVLLMSGWIVAFLIYAALTQKGWRMAWNGSHPELVTTGNRVGVIEAVEVEKS